MPTTDRMAPEQETALALASSSRARPRHIGRVDAPTVLLHWLVSLLALASFATGFRIAGDAPEVGWPSAIASVMPQGDVINWHVIAAWCLVASIAGYVVFLFRARVQRRVAFDATRRRMLASKTWHLRSRAINVLIYWLGFGLISAATLTGTLLFSDTAPISASTLSWLHRGIAISLTGFVLLHVAGHLASGGWRALLPIVLPRFIRGRAFAFALLGVVAVAGLVFAVEALTVRTLVMPRVAAPPMLDGDPTDPTWDAAEAITIQTRGGANLPDGEAPVTVRAVQHGGDAYFLFQWPDTTRSLKHVPIQKTAAGWRLLQDGFDRNDEDVFYEDKFGVMLTDRSRFAALRAIHLGPKPLDGKPGGSGGRGLHYTTDGSVLDIWHWMAVRSNPMGQLEDSYFGAAKLESDNPMDRYYAGIGADPAMRDGAISNWRPLLQGPAARSTDGGVIPRFLPNDPEDMVRLQEADLDPETSDNGVWWLTMNNAVPYAPEMETSYPEGTIVPSVVLRQTLEGDRTDVAAVGAWKDGYWNLEVRRALDTGSQYDVPISDGVYLWVSVFDHTQTRHSWHIRPVRLRIR
ncbi:MAG: ethylbenzene dehydrogenase-related protein [Sedimentitalea sp.]|uniref:ethylbenzene dehydrogenase-related protein n=1 Tax=Sedimentitalea sp. TaxID=2048915 RepID=UPI003262FEA7